VTPGAQIIAHRGFSARAPENTLASLRAAVESGAPAVEFDLRTAACGTTVLFHDEMLGRTTNGVGPLVRRSLGQLRVLDAGSWFGAEFAGERIPTQEEALALLTGRIKGVFQDIKGYRELEDLDRMVAVTRDAGLAGLTTFLSSDWMVLNRLKRTAPDIRRGYVVEDPGRFPEALDRSVVDEGSLLDLEAGMALEHPALVEEALRAGVEVGVWTVDDPLIARSALDLGITCITTNEVERIMAGLDRPVSPPG
jgi:glycerophosphoryl diester phosphodiesterase